MPSKKATISDLVEEYFTNHPNVDWEHGPVVDYVEDRYFSLYGRKPRDPWRAIRNLHQRGFLIQVRKGVYRYDPESVAEITLEDFTPEQRREVLYRDEYRCVICGRGIQDGVELHVDHIRPRNRGGLAIIENAQTLCAQHNFIKKQSNQTETGKRMFIRLYDLAKKEDNGELAEFCGAILETYEKYRINDHIEWNR